MSISQALHTGVTGLSVMSDAMSVVANNLANANAKGFKYDRTEFGDLLSADIGSGTGSSQLGRGAKLSRVRTIHTQGGLAVTDRLTDMAVQGSGFFIVDNPKGDVKGAGGQLFTRVGAFNFNKDGYLADSGGGKVQGYMANENGKLSTELSDMRLVTNNLPPNPTTKIVMNVNLDSRSEPMLEEFGIERPEETSNFVNTVNVYVSHGTRHALTSYFRRLETDEGIAWQWHATVDGSEVTDADGAKRKEVASGIVRFNTQGALVSEEYGESSINFSKGAIPGQKILIDFGKNISTEDGNGVGATSSTASEGITVFHTQNGYRSGNIKSLKIELDGSLRGYYTNGIQKLIGGIALANFENVDGLSKAGRNQFFATLRSGAPRIGMPQTGARGSVFASTLEQSNVDLAAQFVEMIVTQRGFQANSRSITTTDSMIEEVVNMKR